MIVRVVVNAINQGKELKGLAAEEFAYIFKKYTIRLVTTAKLQANN